MRDSRRAAPTPNAHHIPARSRALQKALGVASMDKKQASHPSSATSHQGGIMKKGGLNRREFLKSAVAGSAVAASTTLPQPAIAQGQPTAAAAAATTSPGYAFLNLEEQAFVEALVDHMVT